MNIDLSTHIAADGLRYPFGQGPTVEPSRPSAGGGLTSVGVGDLTFDPATQAELDASISAALAGDASALASAVSTINVALATKPSSASVTSALALKADSSAMTTALGLKADSSSLGSAAAHAATDFDTKGAAIVAALIYGD